MHVPQSIKRHIFTFSSAPPHSRIKWRHLSTSDSIVVVEAPASLISFQFQSIERNFGCVKLAKRRTMSLRSLHPFARHSIIFLPTRTAATNSTLTHIIRFNRFSSSSVDQVFLHVGPSGDCWTGSSIFAAKHLQPDYVKSIPIPNNVCVDALMEKIQDDEKLMQQVYDEGKLPAHLLLTTNDCEEKS